MSGTKDKDLDASVMWKGFQSTQSSLSFLKQRAIQSIDHSALRSFDTQHSKEPDVFKAAAAAVASSFAATYLFHPILVTHSHMWRTVDSGLEPVEHVRFWQIDEYGVPFGWIDVVQFDSFEGDAQGVTEYYNDALSRRGFGTNAGQSIADELYAFLLNEP